MLKLSQEGSDERHLSMGIADLSNDEIRASFSIIQITQGDLDRVNQIVYP